jgi:hypothetical protein
MTRNATAAAAGNAETKQKYLRIGQVKKGTGGVFAGIVRGRDGAPDYYLIVGPDLGALNWDDAKKAAAAVTVDGHKDFELPYRTEQAIMYGNVPELFEKRWYWSQEQSAGYESRAWAQYFSFGLQDWHLKCDGFRARAVRRVPIE